MKQLKIVLGIIILIIAAFVVFIFFTTKAQKQPQIQQASTPGLNDPPRVTSTNPDLSVDGAIIFANDPLEITFNRPIENEGEFKIRIEPKVEFKIRLDNQRKTGIISFEKPLELGTSYTLFIGPETKFDNMGRWGEEKVFHFRTIPYKGV